MNPQNKLNVLSLATHLLGDWQVKVSANDWDESVLVVAFNPIFRYTVLRRFDEATEAREWLNALVKSSIIIEREDLDNE